jgi:hypothetical protein
VTPLALGSLRDGGQPLTRIHIVGTTGSGKSTFAGRLGQLLALPVHDLDTVARVGGGRGPVRTDTERQALLARIIEQPGWITEGVHVGWTESLLEQAQLIVWLDHVSPSVARRRVVLRFLRSAAGEARRRKGRERFLRFRDYAGQVHGLIAHLSSMNGSRGRQPSSAAETRAAIVRALEPHRNRVVRCERRADVEAVMSQIAALANGPRTHVNQ